MSIYLYLENDVSHRYTQVTSTASTLGYPKTSYNKKAETNFVSAFLNYCSLEGDPQASSFLFYLIKLYLRALRPAGG